MAKLISIKYANAFFDIAVEENKTDLFYDEAKFIYDSVSANKEFAEVLAHPDIVSEEKLEILKKVFEGKVSQEFISLFSLVLRKNRESELCNILKEFMDKVLDYKRITTAFVTSATALSEEQLKNIKEKLSANLNKQVNIEATVDKSLIGGIRISVDGHIIDATIKKQLNDLKQDLLNIQLAQ